MFTSVDPMMQYWNSFSYCGGNPINRIDPDGNSDVEVTSGVWENFADGTNEIWTFGGY